jgi:ABC-type branched-subunit amino acid transport system substrate-binding protein
MSRLRIFMVLVAAAPFAAGESSAQETIKIGAVQSMTGSFNPIGK